MSPRPHSHARAPRGIALITVLVIVALGVVAVLGAFRLASLAEASTGNASDYSRTFAAAEAVLRDAEHDVRGRLPDLANAGGIWSPNAIDGGLGLPCRNTTPPAGRVFVGCREVDDVPGSSQDFQWIPRNVQDYTDNFLAAMSLAGATRCRQGICLPESMAALANLHRPPLLGQVFSAGTSYGRFTGATAATASGNPALSENRDNTTLPADGQPWSRYWIEVFRYGSSVSNGATAASELVPDPTAPFVYRITAIAQGRKPGSRVVLREIFIPNPVSQNN